MYFYEKATVIAATEDGEAMAEPMESSETGPSAVAIYVATMSAPRRNGAAHWP